MAVTRRVKESPLPQPPAGLAPLLADPPGGYLLEAARKGELRGSILLLGEEGIGKKRLALDLVRKLNCDGDPPGSVCNTCRRILLGSHPDLTLVQPDGEFIKVESVRSVIESSVTRPYESRFRAVIVDEADRLHPSAANALLKTLEEPPDFLVFFLISSRPEKLLPTIRSRSESHFVPTPLVEDAGEWLAKIGWNREEIERGTRFGGGRIGFLLRGGYRRLEPLREKILEALERFADPKSSGAPLSDLAAILAEADETEEVVWIAASLLRDVRVVRDDPEGKEVRHRDLFGRLRDLSPRLSPHFVDGLAIDLLRVPERLSMNPNRKLLFEEILLTSATRLSTRI